MIDFSRRLEAPELMDLPGCDPVMLKRTYRHFAVTNILFTDSRRLTRRYFFPVMLADPEGHYTLLDVGAGGGDFARWMVRTARKRGWKLSVTAMEYDERVVPWLTEWTRAYPEIQVRKGGTSEDLAHVEKHDFVFSNHVLHHIPADSLHAFVNNCSRIADRAMVLTDLRRSAWAWFALSVFGPLFLRASCIRADGPLSIRRAYKPEELTAIASDAGAEVITGFPARLAISRRHRSQASEAP